MNIQYGSYVNVSVVLSLILSKASGHFPEGLDADICPAGSYCPEGSDSPTPCPIGTFSASTGLSMSAECTVCTSGSYCDVTGMTTTTGLCQEGYFCVEGSDSIDEEVCPVGHYCVEGTHIPQPCPAGTFSNTVGLTAVGECTDCTETKYCDDTGLTAPVGDCTAGKYTTFCLQEKINTTQWRV